MIRVYRGGSGGLRFAGKDPEAERLAVRAILAERREFEERLHERNMALLGENLSLGEHEVIHLIRDEGEEALWRAWRLYSA